MAKRYDPRNNNEKESTIKQLGSPSSLSKTSTIKEWQKSLEISTNSSAGYQHIQNELQKQGSNSSHSSSYNKEYSLKSGFTSPLSATSRFDENDYFYKFFERKDFKIYMCEHSFQPNTDDKGYANTASVMNKGQIRGILIVSEGSFLFINQIINSL